MLIIDKNFKNPNYGYWCNAGGDLHYHAKYYLEEYELPHELRWLYNNLWGDGYDNPCYLMDMNKQYGLAFVVEYDTYTAEDCGFYEETLKTDLFKKAVVAASGIEMEIDTDKIVTIEPNDFDQNGWCIIVFIPFNELCGKEMTTDKLMKISKDISKIAY